MKEEQERLLPELARLSASLKEPLTEEEKSERRERIFNTEWCPYRGRLKGFTVTDGGACD